MERYNGPDVEDTDDMKLIRKNIPDFLLNSKFVLRLNKLVPEELQNDLLFVLNGGAKGFIIAFGAFTLLKKKADLQIMRRALAVASFSGSVRLVDRLFKYLDIFRKKQAYQLLPSWVTSLLEILRLYPRGIQGALGTLSALMIDNSFGIFSI